MNYDYLKPFCNSESQRELVEAMSNSMTYQQASELLGRDLSNLRKSFLVIKARAAKKGVAPESDLNHPVPGGVAVKGVSTLYGKDGNVTAQWVKTDQQAEDA